MEHTRCGEASAPPKGRFRRGPVGPHVSRRGGEGYSPPESPVTLWRNTMPCPVFARHRVVVEVALNDRLQPSHRFGAPRSCMRSRSCCLICRSLAPHALANRLAPHREVPFAILPADVREAQEIERLWLAFSSSFPVWFGKPARTRSGAFFLDGVPTQTSPAVS